MLTDFHLALPSGSTYVSCAAFGKSAWTDTSKVTANNADGTEELYFLKARARCFFDQESDDQKWHDTDESAI